MNTNSPPTHPQIGRFLKAIAPWYDGYRSSTFTFVAVLHASQLVVIQARLRLTVNVDQKADTFSTASIRAGVVPIAARIDALASLLQAVMTGDPFYMEPFNLSFLKDTVTGYSVHHDHPPSPSRTPDRIYVERLILNGVRRAEILDHAREIELERELLPHGFRSISELMQRYDFDLYSTDMFGIEVIAEPAVVIAPESSRQRGAMKLVVYLAAKLPSEGCTISLIDVPSNGRSFRYPVRPDEISWEGAGSSDVVGTCNLQVPIDGLLSCRVGYGGALHDEMQFEPHTEESQTPLPQSAHASSSLVTREEHYERVLQAIRNQGRQFERTPSTYSVHGEEQLRDFILGNLSTLFGACVNGEAFSRSGKTDILIERDGCTSFIAECKVWNGPKELQNAVIQLLGYLRWRDYNAALIVFNKDRNNFTSLLERALISLRSMPLFRREVAMSKEPGEARIVLSAPDDHAREVTIHLFLFDLCVPKSS